MARKHADQEITVIDGHEYRIIGRGITNEAGLTYCHLASTTQGAQQRNGFVPRQIMEWVNLSSTDAA